MTIELVTTGRLTGIRRAVEIWWFSVQERFVVTGTPGARDWYANVLCEPRIAVRVGHREHPGVARPITDPEFRRVVFTDPRVSWYSTQAELDRLVAEAPMIEIELE